jgi:hypothetical protein
MRKFLTTVIVVVIMMAIGAFISLSTTTQTKAAGPHEVVACLGCHNVHYAVAEKIFGVRNTVYANPRTKMGLEATAAELCLGCHALTDLGGAGVRPIHLHTTHPIGIKPNAEVANVPANLLRKGILDCISCHDPHPSNKNYMYLRIDVGPADNHNIQKFCTMCHPNKGDLEALGITDATNRQIFSSMDEREVGKRFFPRTQAVTNHITPYYVTPLGKYPGNQSAVQGKAPSKRVPEFVADPMVDVLKMFQAIKSSQGYKSTTAEDGKQNKAPIDEAPMKEGKKREDIFGTSDTKKG